MKRFKVLQNFTWRRLALESGQFIEIQPHSVSLSIVRLAGRSDGILVPHRSVDAALMAEKIDFA